MMSSSSQQSNSNAPLASPRRRKRGQSSSLSSLFRKNRARLLNQKVILFLAAVPLVLLVIVWLLLIGKMTMTALPQQVPPPISPDLLLSGSDAGAVAGTTADTLDKAQGLTKKHKKKQQLSHYTKNEQPLPTTTTLARQHDGKLHSESLSHNFRIPNILTFTHSVNLLTATNVTGEDVALQRNVLNTIKLHNGGPKNAQVYFWTDDECMASIQRVMMGNSSHKHSTDNENTQHHPLVHYFQTEPHGMYKADICRGAALYEHGGLYFDVDVQARMSMWEVPSITPATTFVTPMVHRQSKYPGAFFQAFIGVSPQNPIMKRYLDLFVLYYEGKIDVQGPLGVLLLRKAHDDVVLKKEQQQQHQQHDDDGQSVVLWQEVLYSSQLFPNVPPPNWGTRRACHFVVVANRKRPFVVPIYSRVKGSRMCGGKESNLRGGGGRK